MPSHLFKIIYDPHRGEAIAFIMPNQSLNSSDLQKYIVSVREVEGKTGLDFLSNLDKDVQDVIESKVQPRLWQ